MQAYLKVQQELFLSFLLDRLVLPSSTSTASGMRKAELEAQLDASTWGANQTRAPERHGERDRDREKDRDRDRDRASGAEARELMLEILAGYGRSKWGPVDLWFNYDCNVEGEDLFERLIRFLCRVRWARVRSRL